MNAVNKIIVYRDYDTKYEVFEFAFGSAIDLPFLVGEQQTIISDDLFQNPNFKGTRNEMHKSIFNTLGIGKIRRQITPDEIFYLELRPQHKITSLITEPNKLDISVFWTSDERLLYSFQLVTASQVMVLKLNIANDSGVAWKQIHDEPANLKLRQSIIQTALVTKPKQSSKKIEWKQSKKEFALMVLGNYKGAPKEYSNLKDATRQLYSKYRFKYTWNKEQCYDLVRRYNT